MDAIHKTFRNANSKEKAVLCSVLYARQLHDRGTPLLGQIQGLIAHLEAHHHYRIVSPEASAMENLKLYGLFTTYSCSKCGKKFGEHSAIGANCPIPDRPRQTWSSRNHFTLKEFS